MNVYRGMFGAEYYFAANSYRDYAGWYYQYASYYTSRMAVIRTRDWDYNDYVFITLINAKKDSYLSQS